MAHVNVKVYDTQAGEYVFDETRSFETMGDVKNAIGYDSRATYKNIQTRMNPFSDLTKIVDGDIEMLKTSAKSKAGA